MGDQRTENVVAVLFFFLWARGKSSLVMGGKKADDAVGWQCEEMAFWELCLCAS